MKKLITFILSLALCLSMVSAFAEESAPVLTQGIYWIGGSGDSTGMPYSWIHFNEDGTYYESSFDGTSLSAGVWALVDEPTEYRIDSNNDKMSEDGDPTATSTQTVLMTPYSTGVEARVAYEDDTLWDISLGGGMANKRYLVHNAEYAYNANVDEQAIQLYVFYANHDIAANFILNHNQTFEDTTGEYFDDGSWEMTGAGEYQLTYFDGSLATLVVESNAKSAVITKADGSVIELRDTYREEETAVVKQMSLVSENVTIPELPMAVNVRLDGYSDGQCQLVIEIAQVGAELVADQGTFEVSASMRPTFHFETAGDVDGEPDYDNVTDHGIPFTVNYSAAVNAEFSGAETAMTLTDVSLTGLYNPYATAEEAASVVTSFRMEDAQVGLPMGVALRLDCYSDSTAVLVVEIAQIDSELEADRGTWEASATMAFTFQFNQAGEVKGIPNYEDVTDEGIAVQVDYKADVEAEFSGAATPLTIDAALTGRYLPAE